MNYTIQKGPENSLLDKLKNCAALFGNCSLALLIAFLALRIIEFIYIAMTNNPPRDFWNVIMQALLYDILSFSTILPFLFIPFIIVYISFRSMKFRYWIYFVGGSIVIILYAMLIKYFATALVPLGADLFGYSIKEIKETIRGGLTFDPISIFLFVIPVIVFWVSLSFIYSRKLFKPVYAFVLLGTGILLICTVSVLPARTSFETELSYNLALNKMVYFVEESYAFFSHSTKGTISAQAPHKEIYKF
jgi:hypothetical protein